MTQQDALVAVMFSVATLEAFINEAADYASHPDWSDHPEYPARLWDPESVKAFGRLVSEVEEAEGSIELKFPKEMRTEWYTANGQYLNKST